ncbi:hypothetical protein PSYMO_36905, partial [Pseudomonas amygdali pv. mori str. 301020]
GVADEHLAQLGEPFYRAPGQTTPLLRQFVSFFGGVGSVL